MLLTMYHVSGRDMKQQVITSSGLSFVTTRGTKSGLSTTDAHSPVMACMRSRRKVRNLRECTQFSYTHVCRHARTALH